MLAFVIKSAAFQTWLGGKVADYYSEEWDVDVRIGSVDVSLIRDMHLRDIYIEDQTGDTLIFAPEIKAKLKDYSLKGKYINIKYVELVQPCINVVKFAEGGFNYEFIEDYFASEDQDTTPTLWKVNLIDLKITDGLVSYSDLKQDRMTSGFDYNYIRASVDLHLADIRQRNDQTVARIKSADIRDKSGFRVRDLKGYLTVLPGGFNIRNLTLKTNKSVIRAHEFEMAGESWKAFDEFVDDVVLRVDFMNGTDVYMSDLAYFADDLKGNKMDLEMNGRVRGTIANLRLKDFFVKFDENSFFSGDFDFDGLPDFDNTFMSLRIDELRTSKDEIERIELPPYNGKNFVELPGNFEYLGYIRVAGSFSGFINDFVAYADLETDIGDLSSDIEFRVHDKSDNFHYRGRLISHNFNIGALYGIQELGPVSADIRIDTAYGLDLNSLYASVYGDVKRLHVNGYDYSEIKINKGTFQKDYFIGDITMRDPNISLDYNGKIDFSKRVPQYDFDILVNNAYLTQLNILKDPADAVICFDMRVDSTHGSSLDNFEGKINVRNISYHDVDTDIDMEGITIRSKISEEERLLSVKSDALDAKITGTYEFENLEHSFRHVVSNILPALIHHEVDEMTDHDDDFKFEVEIHDMSDVAAFLGIDLYIEPGTKLSGEYNSFEDEIEINGYSGLIRSKDFWVTDAEISGKKWMDLASLTVKSSEIHLADSAFLQNVIISTRPWYDVVEVGISWHNDDSLRKSAVDQGRIDGFFDIYGQDKFVFTFDSTTFRLLDQQWTIDSGATVVYDSSDMDFRNIIICGEKQQVVIDGKISPDPDETLLVQFEKFNLSNLNPLINKDDLKIHGIMNGKSEISNIYEIPRLISDITIDTLKINKSPVGNVDFSSTWNGNESSMGFLGNLDRGAYKSLDFKGTYYLERETDNLDFTITFDETDLGVVNEFLSTEDISDFHAYASGKVRITGEPDNPRLKGKLKFIDGQVRINYLNTRYFFGGDILVEKDMIAVERMYVSDEETYLLDLPSNGKVWGQLYHENFEPESFNYNFDLEFTKMMLLNTTYTDNPLFYGVVYGSGLVNIFSQDELIEINISQAVTEKGTKFNLPLYGADEIVLQDFVRFVSEGTKTTEDYEVDLENIRLTMALDVTKDADVLILFDPAIGDIMAGSAEGHLDIEITELGDFLMTGDLEVVEGEYLFTMYNVINKRFTIEPGGTIKWVSGSPYDALIDLNTIYSTRAPLYNLVQVEEEKYRKKSVVNCYMNLKNDLYNPDLAFDIKIPKGDQNVEAALNKLRSDNEEMTKQFFSLLVINNFVSGTGGGYGNAALNATTADLLNNQLSNWLSQLSDEVDIGFHYSPGDNLTQKELALAFETQLLNERLLLSGNFGYAQGTTVTNNSSNLIGDFTVEYKVNEDGTFRIKGFNETNDFDYTNTTQSRYTQGVGVYYTEDFDKVSELKIIKTIKGWFKPKKDKKEKARSAGQDDPSGDPDDDTPNPPDQGIKEDDD